MNVRVQTSGLGPVTELTDAQSIVIYDDYGQPIQAIQRVEKGQILSVKAGDPKFAKVLESMGIGLNARTIVASKTGDGNGP